VIYEDDLDPTARNNRENGVYYRLMVNREFGVSVVCMQNFDEVDYDQKRFLTEQKFDTEELAEDWVVNNFGFCREVIDMSRSIGEDYD
jgi:hypothetical protein